MRAPTLQAGGWPPNAGGSVSTLVIEWVPLKPELGVSCFWWLLIFAGWPRRTPFGGAENPPITFIRELKKEVRRSFALLGEGQSAISDRAGDAHGISNPKATEHGFRLCQQRRPEAFREHAPSLTGAKSGKASLGGAIASLPQYGDREWKYIGAAENLRGAPELCRPARPEPADQTPGPPKGRRVRGLPAVAPIATVRAKVWRANPRQFQLPSR